MRLPFTYFILLISATLCLTQFVRPPSPDSFTVVQGPLGITVRYRQVATGPNSICELDGSVKSYAGYVDVAPHQHIFFWLFESRQNPPQQAPLTAWTSGGPGDASMSELFTEHGPCRVDGRSLLLEQYIEHGYIDQDSCDIIRLPNATCPPKHRGVNNCIEYGIDSCGTFADPVPRYTANSTVNAGITFWRTLQGIYAAFPEYTSNGFNFGSESYGGHYVPVFSRYIQQQNKNLPYGAVRIPLQNVVITNGWLDPAVGYEAYYKFMVSPGNTYDVRFPHKSAATGMHDALYGAGKCLDQLKRCNSASGTDRICRIGDGFCDKHVSKVYDRQTGLDQYDVREKNPSPYPSLHYVNYLNTDHVQRTLGVFTNYTDFSHVVDYTFGSTGDDGKELGIIQALADLLDAGIGVSLLYGDADYSCNWYGGEISAQHIIDSTSSAGLAAAYKRAGYQNISTTDGLVHGQVKQAGRFSFVRVYQAGHQVGFFQTSMEQALFNRTVHGKDLATGLQDAIPDSGGLYSSSGPANSTYIEGHSRKLPHQK